MLNLSDVDKRVVVSEANDLVNSFEPRSVDFSLFSPPYDNVRDYCGGSIDLGGLVKILGGLSSVLKEGGLVAIVIQDSTHKFAKSATTFHLVSDVLRQTDLRLFECLIYHKNGRPGVWYNTRFRVDHEYILLFLKGPKPQFFSKKHMFVPAKHSGSKLGGTYRRTSGALDKYTGLGVQKTTKCPGTVLFYPTSNSERNKIKCQHPATMPDKLAKDLIEAFCPPEGIVLDPFCGSGTTLVMAEKLGRKGFGGDISAHYVDIAKKRLCEEVLNINTHRG